MNMNEIYKQLLVETYTGGIETSPRGKLTRELIAARVKIDPRDNIVTLPGFETNLEYAQAELAWYLSGTNDFRKLCKFSKVWEKYSDDGKTVNSAYGYQMLGNHPDCHGINQLQWVEDELRRDPDSRRCVVNINFPVHKLSKSDVPCTIALQFLVREGELICIAYMRSNDLYYGFRNDVYCFTEMQKMLAKKLEVGIGPYFHVAGSLHLYEKELAKVKEAFITEAKLKC